MVTLPAWRLLSILHRADKASIRCRPVNSALGVATRMARDEFSSTTKDALAKRVALRCSNPACRALTVGPHSVSAQTVNVGVASHITAASPGGPRYDPNMTEVQRSSIDNGIWLCQTCAKLVDNDPARYTAGALNTWKINSEASTLRDVLGDEELSYYPLPPMATHTPLPHIHEMPYDEARSRLVRSGWQPSFHHFSHADEDSLQYGNGLYFWEKGYHEIENSWGTGLGQCTFLFHDVYGTKLRVVTVGEVIPEMNATAHVRSWHFLKDGDV